MGIVIIPLGLSRGGERCVYDHHIERAQEGMVFLSALESVHLFFKPHLELSFLKAILFISNKNNFLMCIYLFGLWDLVH